MTPTPPSSARASQRGRPAPKQSSSAAPMLIGVVALALGGVLFLFLKGGGKAAPAETPGAPSNSAQPAVQRASNAPAAAPSRDSFESMSGTARAGKQPKTPAPPIQEADLRTADGHYQQAKALWASAQEKRTAGKNAEFQEYVHKAFAEMEKINVALGRYTDWMEEADLGGWAITAEYDALQRRLSRYDALRNTVRKVKSAEKR